MPLNPPTRLNDAVDGGYCIERRLGKGGMATGYLADDLKQDRKVTAKLPQPELAEVAGPERYLTEIEGTADVQHSHLLPVLREGGGLLLRVMPSAAGESSRRRLDPIHQVPAAWTRR